ncbi:hypothetical protein [uncultured Slackia sp.]|uniref:protein kinase domain-containing protein n=1 Tax=uncultured Slackia sp. TaxID=665903 RepID=UPI0025E9C29C|nr:hypothetical protein [uncultured Slackia sp.]
MNEDANGARPTALWGPETLSSFDAQSSTASADGFTEPVEGSRCTFAVADCASPDLSGASALTFGIADRTGQGGMSGTYAAVVHADDASKLQRLEGKTVLLKIASSQRAAENEWRHLKEFRSLSALPEPYFLLTGHDEHGVERYAIAMELLQGETLASWAQRWTDKFGCPPAVEYVIDALSPVLDFIKVASTARPPLVHRDIKPTNIIVQQLPGKKPACRLIDLGISYRTDVSNDGILPGTLSSPGTWGFAPPEVMEHRTSGAGGVSEVFSDPRIDTFGLAATLYSVLSGKTYAYHWDGGFALVHWWDQQHRFSLYDNLRSYLCAHSAVIPDIRVATDAIQAAIDAIDADIMDALGRGLSDNASKRPLPGEFIDELRRCCVESKRGAVFSSSGYHKLLEEKMDSEKAKLPRYVMPASDPDEVMALDELCNVPVKGMAKIRMGKAVDQWCRARQREEELAYLRDDYVRSSVFAENPDSAKRQIGEQSAKIEKELQGLKDLATGALKDLAKFPSPPKYPLCHLLYGFCLKDWNYLGTMDDVVAHWMCAADGGLTLAMYNVGVYYEHCRYGKGADDYLKRVTDAKYWYGLALEHGFEDARPRYEAMRAEENAQSLTDMWLEGSREQQVAAQREALEWKRSGVKGKFVRWDDKGE